MESSDYSPLKYEMSFCLSDVKGDADCDYINEKYIFDGETSVPEELLQISDNLSHPEESEEIIRYIDGDVQFFNEEIIQEDIPGNEVILESEGGSISYEYDEEELSTEPQSIQYACSDCGKWYKDEAGLQRHKDSTMKKLHCVVCSSHGVVPCEARHMKLSNCSRSANATLKRTKPAPKPKPVTKTRKKRELKHFCEYCGRRFCLMASLEQHLWKVHEQGSLHECSECTQAFTRAQQLQAHEMKVHGKLPYKCNECQITFVSTAAREKHQKTDHQVLFHLCMECNLTFDNVASWKSHKICVHEARSKMMMAALR